MIHEGGYAPAYAPYCGLAVLEELSGIRTAAEDPFLPIFEGYGYQELQPQQEAVIAEVERLLEELHMTVRPQDLGGRHGFGPVPIEQDEPVFHADWEASVIAGILATISAGLYNVDQFREGIDDLEPLSYLTLGYYRRWLHTLEVNCVKSGVFTHEQLERADRGDRRAARAPAGRDNARSPSGMRNLIYFSAPALGRSTPPAFAVGDARARARARGRAPRAHPASTRRASAAPCCRVGPAFPDPDTNRAGQGERPEHVYSVRFAGRELWPDGDASSDDRRRPVGVVPRARPGRSGMSTITTDANAYAALRTRAIESLLIEKGLLSEEAVDVVVEAYGSDIGPLHGARVVARAWIDPAVQGAPAGGRHGGGARAGRRRLRVRVRARRREHRRAAQPRRVHALLVLPVGPARPAAHLVQVARVPLARRARAARGAARVRRRAATTETEIRIWDSSADLRYIVLPQRPAGHARTWRRTSSRRSSRASR